MKIKIEAYEALSVIYDEVMKHIDYKHWSEYILDIAKDHNKDNNARVLELSAGIGKMARRISKKFSDYVFTDRSFRMLQQSNEINLRKVCCDMTSLPFNGEFDFIFSTFDSVNYLLNKSKLLSLFTEVKNVLSENGIFTFDVSLENNSLEFKRNQKTKGSAKGYSFKRTSKYNLKSRIHKNIFEITDHLGVVTEEVHKQKIYKFDTYFELINEAGLVVVECLEAFTFNHGNENSERIQFILKPIGKNVKF
ncbi:MAG: class I SAM-dependent methyltransferase [Ignavibacterium sp.]|nr:MAG: class I SAM-dependent methyltransferase [Ignavibacterium sp.]